jgi:hypothetical protein
MSTDGFIIALILGVIAVSVAIGWYSSWRQLRRAEFIRSYRWPPGLLDKLSRQHPALQRKESALVSSGLRQFFLAYLMGGRKFVSMPSQVADDLWHEFILYTREYQSFCRQAFGTFLHHTPAVVLGENRQNNEGLRRVWWQCCKEESIDPRQPTRLPLLFALDAKLKIPNGFVYQADCEPWRQRDDKAAPAGIVHCGGDFSSSSADGGTAGFGDAGSGSDGGDGGGGCGGGGCGGGGD